MGVARLLAKAWVVFCIFTAAHALAGNLDQGIPAHTAFGSTGIAALLFGAMGLLFIVGYGVSSGHHFGRFSSRFLIPQFNELICIVFLIISLWVGIAHVPPMKAGAALEAAMHFGVPGQRALESTLVRCALDRQHAFSAAVAWLLAFIFLGSAISRVRVTARLVRLERQGAVEPLGPTGLAMILGILAMIGIQMFFMGSIFRTLSCDAASGLLGSVLTGAAPLMLAYLTSAALVSMLAIHPEG